MEERNIKDAGTGVYLLGAISVPLLFLSVKRFNRTVRQGEVAIIQFKESGGHTLVFENSDEEFRDWHCAQCKRRIEDSLMVRGLDRRVEEWQKQSSITHSLALRHD